MKNQIAVARINVGWIMLLLVTTVVLGERLTAQINTPSNNLQKLFQSPPPGASPWVFWYWNQASVSRRLHQKTGKISGFGKNFYCKNNW